MSVKAAGPQIGKRRILIEGVEPPAKPAAPPKAPTARDGNTNLFVGPAIGVMPPGFGDNVLAEAGDLLYVMRDGVPHPVARVEAMTIEVHREEIDVTTFGDAKPQFISGVPEGKIQYRAVAYVGEVLDP